MAAGEEDAAVEVVEGVETITVTFEDLDAVAESLAGAVGLSVLDIGAVPSDGAGTAPDALTVRDGVSREPPGKGVALLRVGGFLKDGMGFLEGVIGLLR